MYRGLTSARVYLAAGLPLTWVSEQKEAFKAYLLQNKEADFTFRGESYHVEFAGADVFPQGFSAVADRLREHEYNPELMKLYVVGGGSCLIRNFTEYDPNRVTINSDICATAKGYELLAQRNLGGAV